MEMLLFRGSRALNRACCSTYGKSNTAQLQYPPEPLMLLTGAFHGALKFRGGKPLLVSWKLCMARPSCLRLFEQLMRAAASRIFWTAGKSNPMRIAMMAITTSSSMRVKPRRPDEGNRVIVNLLPHPAPGRLAGAREERDEE